MSRGNRRQHSYLDDVDRQDFLKTLAEAGQKAGWQIHAYGLQQDSPEARLEFEGRTEARRLEAGDEEGLKALRRGWCMGSDQFKQQKLEELDGQVGQQHFGQMRQEVAQAKAERIISDELRRLGWGETQLAIRPKRDPRKLEIAVRLRKETTLSVKHIAARLHLGTPASASLCLLAALRKTTTAAPMQSHLAI